MLTASSISSPICPNIVRDREGRQRDDRGAVERAPERLREVAVPRRLGRDDVDRPREIALERVAYAAIRVQA